MKKNLAKKIVLGLLTGAVLMSSSVAWAKGFVIGPEVVLQNNGGDFNTASESGIAIGHRSYATGKYSIAIGNNTAQDTYTEADKDKSIAIGVSAKANGNNSVALGYGSVAVDPDVVSVGSGTGTGQTRRIVNVTAGVLDTDVATVGQVKDKYGEGKTYLANNGSELIKGKNLTQAVVALDGAVYGLEQDKADKATTLEGYGIEDAYTKEEANGIFLTIDGAANTYVQIQKDNNNPDKTTTTIGDFIIADAGTGSSSTVTINEGDKEQVVFDEDGITVGKNSTRMDSTGFYAGGAKPHNYGNAAAAIDEKGRIKGAAGKFEVGTEGEIKAANGSFKVDASGNVTAEKITAKEVTADNLYTKDEIDQKLGGSNASVAGLSQRLDKTNAKINKVGAGAAALAALHPLEYDPDDKLTFSAGMGNYAGENAAALGAFYRPNEKFMVSLGGTMGNGENMVNLGLSIGLDKPNGYAKLSKRELIQKVNVMEAKYEQVEAENEAMKDQLANADERIAKADERIAKLEALVAQLVKK